MAVSVKDIKSLDDKHIYQTSNESVVLSRDFEKIIHNSEYRILGFLNNYMYYCSGSYLTKCTLNGDDIAYINIDIDHCSFVEGNDSFFGFYENKLYRITENLEIKWTKEFDMDIENIQMDIKSSVYVLFKSSRGIRKILKDGSEIAYIDSSEDPTKSVRLFNCRVSKGAGWIYVIGSEYWDYDNKVQAFIDKYDTRSWERVDRQIIYSDTNITEDDTMYHFTKFFIKGNYFYVFAKQFISKMNIKGLEIWNHSMGYNPATKQYDQIGHIEYSDNPMEEFIYFTEDLSSSNGHSFGKLNINGKVVWKITMTDSIEKVDFRLCVYQNKLYVSSRSFIQAKKGYILSLDDNRILFKTRNGHLIKIVEYNDTELYSPDNFASSRLLGDKLKDGVPKIIQCPLRHDYGDIVDEGGNVLILDEPNEYWNDPDNYNYFYLLGSMYQFDGPSISTLVTKTVKPIISKLKNRIKTKDVYTPDTMYEFILSKEGNRIDSMQDKDLVRSRFKYSYDRYLLADRNMFATDIITKEFGYSIITKKHGYNIVRKSRNIYAYTLSKYDDISLIEEWLKENGVTDTSLPKYVDELRHHTVNMIEDIQIAGVPTIYDVQAYKQFEFTYDGWEYPNNTWGTQIFSCTNLPFDKRNSRHKIYMDSIANLVAAQEMRPVLFFIDGKAVKWSDCTIVRDWSYSYVVINHTNPYENDLSCIIFPCDIRYGEDNDCLPEEVCDTYLYFDSIGRITENRDNVCIRVEIIDENIVGSTTKNTNIIMIDNEYNQLSSERNVLVFENNRLFPDSRFYLTDHGEDIYKYHRNDDNKRIIFKGFYYIKANPYYGIENKLQNEEEVLNESLFEAMGLQETSTQRFDIPFDFKLYRSKTWSENIAQAVEYIMRYDMSLLIQYYKEESMISSTVYTGSDIMHRASYYGGWLTMPRQHRKNSDDFIMVFRNDHLYEFYKEIQYEPRWFKIPIFGHVNREDKIEIVHFRNVDNSYYSLNIADRTIDYIPENLRNDNFLLFSNCPSGKEFYTNFSVESSVQYDVDFSYRNIYDGSKYTGTEFKITDPYYKGKDLNISSKNQFRYMYYNIFSDRNEVNLSPDFRFCHEKNRYMIFLNWMILPQEKWELNIMTNESPKQYISILFRDQLHIGDRIDIFYLPTAYDEVDITADIDWDMYNLNRDIIISNDKLGYSFDKDLFMISIDGHKINHSAIQNINNHRFRLYRDMMHVLDDEADDHASWPHDNKVSIKRDIPFNIKLYRFLQPDKLLSKLFSYSDMWSDAVDSMTPKEYKELLTIRTKV